MNYKDVIKQIKKLNILKYWFPQFLPFILIPFLTAESVLKMYEYFYNDGLSTNAQISIGFGILLQFFTIFSILRKNVIILNVVQCTTFLGTILAFETAARRWIADAHRSFFVEIKLQRNEVRDNIFHEMFIFKLNPLIDAISWRFGLVTVFVGLLQCLLINQTIKYFEQRKAKLEEQKDAEKQII